MCGKGTKQVTSNTPPAYIQSAQQSAIGAAQQAASKPYVPYTGELTAPINSTQQGAINTLTDLAGNKITTPELTSEQISKYLSPYQQQVVDATIASQNNQNAQQANSLKGNAISAGAWGGDRAGVAQAQLAGQQKIADNLTIAQLYNQGYNSALNTAQGQQALGLQTQIANQQLGVAGANALLNAGTLQQQQQQLADLTNYQQWQNAQQYPFQTAQFLANVVGGVQGGAGQTQTTSQGGNFFSDLLGTGLGIAGLFFKDGGSVPEGDVQYRASGGMSGSPYGQDTLAAIMPYLSYMANQRQKQQQDPLGTVAVTPNQMTHLGGSGGMFDTGESKLGPAIRDMGYGAAHWLGNLFADGGKVPGYATGGMPFGGGLPYQSPFAGSADEPMSLADLGSIVPPNVTPMVPNTAATQIKPAPSLADAGNDNADVAPAVAGAPAIKSLADLQTDTSWMGRHADNPLLNTGLAILAGSHDPNAAAIGRGGLSAIQGYHEQRKQQFEQAKELHSADIQDKTLQNSVDRLHQEAKQAADTLALNTNKFEYDKTHDADELTIKMDELAQNKALHEAQIAAEKARTAQGWAQLEQGKYSLMPGMGKDAQGNDVAGSYLLNSKTGQTEFRPGVVMTPKGMANPSQLDATANLIATYKMAPPSPMRATTPEGLALMQAVKKINPDYDGAQFPSRSKAVAAFATGKQGDTVRSLNVSIAHLEILKELGDALKNGDVNLINRARQAFAEQFGVPAPANFDAARSIVADEVAKGVIGGQTAQSDRETLAETLRKSNSPQQIDGAINTFQHLLGGQLHGLRQQYEQTTGLKDFGNKLLPETKTALGWKESGASAPQANHADQSVPQRPASVPAGSQYSPSRKQWRDASGKIYDASGKPQ